MTSPSDLSNAIAASAMRYELKLRGDIQEPGWTFWELRTLNRHRMVGLLNDSRKLADAYDLENEIRSAASRNFRRAWWRGFAYGVAVKLPANNWSAWDLEGLVDIHENRKGVLQWVVLATDDSHTAVGVHTWMETYLSPVYRDILHTLTAAGYRVSTAIRGKDGMLKFLTGVAEMRGVAFPEFRE